MIIPFIDYHQPHILHKYVRHFSDPVKRALASRVGNLCSNPDCRALTSGPQEDPGKAVNLGVAAHITAASLGGPRYYAELLPEERSGSPNGIWLCQNCAKLVDLSFNSTSSKPTRPHVRPSHAHRSVRQAPVPAPGTVAGVSSAQTLREHAKQGTAAIMLSLKFRQVYGFSPTHDYQLAVRTAGEIPSNREIYREFIEFLRQVWRTDTAICHIQFGSAALRPAASS